MTYDIGNPGLLDKNTYIEDAMRTCSDKYFGEYVGREHLRNVLRNAIAALQEVDRIKKALFYGKERVGDTNDKGVRVPNCVSVPHDVAYGLAHREALSTNKDSFVADPFVGVSAQIIHGVLGVATEGGEMLEALYVAVFEGKDLDLVNLREERGDLKWYLAILAHAQGDDWSEDEKRNIAKLRKRFPDKFEQSQALFRNLEVERKTLENRLPPERLTD